MKTFTSALLALTATLSLASAIPSRVRPRAGAPSDVAVTLIAADGQYVVYVPFGKSVSTSNYDGNELGISRVNYDHNKYYCTFTGADQATAPPVEQDDCYGPECGLGPPQQITDVYCNEKYDKRDSVDSFYITLRGATNDEHDKFWISVTDDWTPVPVYNSLGVSKASYDFNTYDCIFNGEDSKAVPANPVYEDGVEWIQLGPPQTIKSVQCKKY